MVDLIVKVIADKSSEGTLLKDAWICLFRLAKNFDIGPLLKSEETFRHLCSNVSTNINDRSLVIAACGFFAFLLSRSREFVEAFVEYRGIEEVIIRAMNAHLHEPDILLPATRCLAFVTEYRKEEKQHDRFGDEIVEAKGLDLLINNLEVQHQPHAISPQIDRALYFPTTRSILNLLRDPGSGKIIPDPVPSRSCGTGETEIVFARSVVNRVNILLENKIVPSLAAILKSCTYREYQTIENIFSIICVLVRAVPPQQKAILTSARVQVMRSHGMGAAVRAAVDTVSYDTHLVAHGDETLITLEDKGWSCSVM